MWLFWQGVGTAISYISYLDAMIVPEICELFIHFALLPLIRSTITNRTHFLPSRSNRWMSHASRDEVCAPVSMRAGSVRSAAKIVTGSTSPIIHIPWSCIEDFVSARVEFCEVKNRTRLSIATLINRRDPQAVLFGNIIFKPLVKQAVC